jgi:hypothetical protein
MPLEDRSPRRDTLDRAYLKHSAKSLGVSALLDRTIGEVEL